MAQEIILSKETMSSIEVAELTGKQHAHVMRDIRALLEQGVSESNFGLGSYSDANGQKRPLYNLTKKGSLILASGYNAMLREKIIDRWEALETGQATPLYQAVNQSQPQLPTDYLSALKALVVSEEERQSLMLENKEQQKMIVKLEEDSKYLNQILKSREAIIVSVIAQDYGLTAADFNKLLDGLGIQYKKSGTWIICSKYLRDGYVTSCIFEFKHKNGQTDTRTTTKWTRKGQKFLYYKLKEHGILPLIERQDY